MTARPVDQGGHAPPPVRFWRVFPYDPAAPAGTPFSAAMVPRGQGSGRFDAPGRTPVWYAAESPVHAVAEALQGLRGQTLDAADLRRAGHALALVELELAPAVVAAVVDLCDPQELARRGIRPDRLASRTVTTTQHSAEQLAADGLPAFRWWSALDGDWHATILFHASLPPDALAFGTPTPLALDAPHVRTACLALGIPLPVLSVPRPARPRPSAKQRRP